MTPLFTFGKPHPDQPTPHITHIHPPAAMPGGEIELHGAHLGPYQATPDSAHPDRLPHITLNDITTPITLARPTRATVRIPEGAFPGDLIVHRALASSNALPVQVATLMTESVHPVANPAADAEGNLFVTLSGSRGQQLPISIFRIDTRNPSPNGEYTLRPFVRNLLNPTGLAFGPDGYLYTSSRAEGTIYRISPAGDVSTYAEGMGIATGIAFDPDGNLFVGDRSGTIFKIARPTPDPDPLVDPALTAREIFVFATLEPSIAAYHLAFNDAGTLYVTGPTTSSSQSIHAIDRDGNASIFSTGLGRPQGMAFDIEDNLYVAASLHGQRGIVRITPERQASLAVSGNNLVGLCFLEHGACALATRDSLYHLELGIHGRPLL
jgi:sugar lactone lactonase YvrE